MTETRPTEPAGGGWASTWITAVLGLAAALTIGYWTSRAVGEADTEAMESPLMLSVARQLVAGPRELYGPFGRRNPLVLIHAPLYYRAAALAAWPLARAGLHPVDAARVAGRLLSVLGLAATMGAAYRLGRLGGLTRRAGWWAALLVAAAPALGGQPFAVRPDLMGVALQTWGAVLALESLLGSRRRLLLASVLFGLAACVKQHLLAAWAVSAAVVAAGWLRGRLGPAALVRVVLPGAAAAGLVYGAEWVVTGGRIWEAAFVAPASVGRVHPGSWGHVAVVVVGLMETVAGLDALLAAAILTAVGARPGIVRAGLAWVGRVVIGLILAFALTQIFMDSAIAGVRTLLAAGFAVLIALPAGLLFERSAFPGSRIDGALWIYLVAELALAVLLLRGSEGAWLNYAIPAIVFGSALTARALARVAGSSALRGAPLSAVLASLAMLISSLNGPWQTLRLERYEAAAAEYIYEQRGRHRSSCFFIDRPGFNRLNGRPELVYDHWLYPVFESIGLAEPRSWWLGPALLSGRVNTVVTTTEDPVIGGTTINLRWLGYRPGANVVPFYVWTR